jgi:hypothetical protein
VPWTALFQTPDKFLESCYLPAGVQLTEISKMKAQTLNACLLHWSERVENGEIAFRFKAVEDSHLRVPKSKKKRPAPVSEDEAEQSSKGDLLSMQLGSTRSGDSGDSNDQEDAWSDAKSVQEETGKGKGTQLPPSRYEQVIVQVLQLNNFPNLPAQPRYLNMCMINLHICSASQERRNMFNC